MITSLKKVDVNMSLKIHFLADHLETFPPNCSDYSDEMGEKFHQILKPFEANYSAKSYINMLGHYCWSICRDEEPETKRRKVNKATFRSNSQS